MINKHFYPILALAVTSLVACSKDTDTGPATTQAVPSVSVRVGLVENAPVQTWVFGEGTARAVSREFLSFETAGRIAYVDPSLKEGDAVVRGQLIAYQEKNRPSSGKRTGENGLSHSAVRNAEADLQLAKNTFERFTLLLEQRSASQQEYDEAKAKLEQARVNYDNAVIVADESRITSPIDGIVARLNIEQGYYFSPQQIQSTSEAGALNTVPVVIIDPSAFEITVQLPSFAYSLVAVGNPVLIEPPEVSGSREAPTPPKQSGSQRSADAVRGVLYAISPSIDPSTRTFAVKIRTTEGAERLQDGAFVTAWLGGLSANDAVTIPLNATRYDKGQPYVFAYNPSTSTVSRQEIRLGLRGDERQQVLAGLDTGMQVVTEGRSRLSDGDRVRLTSTSSGSQ